MGSLDVDSLFTNIPFKETTDIFTNFLYNNVDVIEDIDKPDFENVLSFATPEWYFDDMFSNILYKQKIGVALGLL